MKQIEATDEAQNIEEISAQLIRDHCRCENCRDPHNGQRLRSVLELDPEPFVSEIEEDDENGLVTFILSDGHSVELSAETVTDITQELVPLNLRGEGAKVLWDAENAPTENFNWLEISIDNALMYEMLDQVVTFGLDGFRSAILLRESAPESFDILSTRQFHFEFQNPTSVIFDNTRLLHSRTGFESSGKRHLQGAYADLDSLISKWSILEDALES